MGTKAHNPRINENLHFQENPVCDQQFSFQSCIAQNQERQLFISETHGQVMTIIGGPRNSMVKKDVTKVSTEGVWKALMGVPVDYNLDIF